MKYNVFGRKEGQEGSTTTFENQNGEGNDNSPRSAASVDMMGVMYVEIKVGRILVS